MQNDPSHPITDGVRNLLFDCAGLTAGDHVLLIGEDCAAPYFDPDLCPQVAQVAQGLGLIPETILAAPIADASQLPDTIRQAMDRADATIFFSRLGDQLRFCLPDQQGRTVMAYTLDAGYLAAPFAAVDFTVMRRLHDALLDRIVASQSYRITDPRGTDLSSPLNPVKEAAIAPFALDLFPVMTFPPVHCHAMEGVLAIDRFVTSSSTRAYDDSILLLDTPILAQVAESRMVAFDGPPDLVAKLTHQLERAASLTGGDPFRLNSWHTGINPGTYFQGDPYADLERWGTVSYGSPRYTHFHAAGIDPGDLAFHLFDATITFDDVPMWDAGRFVFLDQPEVQSLIPDAARAMLHSGVVHTIGIGA